VLNLWARYRFHVGEGMKNYTDGYRDALLDLKHEIADRPEMTLKDVDTLLDELIQDLRLL
jgi:hypothetical protein